MESNNELKVRWQAANIRALRSSQIDSKGLSMPESPLAQALEIEVGSTLTEEELKAKIKAHEARKPGFMRASYKGCCLTELKKGFPKFYMKVLSSMLNPAQKKSLRKQAKIRGLIKEVEDNETIQAAIRLFNPTKVETKPHRRPNKARRHRFMYGRNVLADKES